jgi:hypothetical protein
MRPLERRRPANRVRAFRSRGDGTRVQCVVGVYLFVMLRRVYSTSVWYAGSVAVAITWSFFHLVWLYRFPLFIITLHSL